MLRFRDDGFLAAARDRHAMLGDGHLRLAFFQSDVEGCAKRGDRAARGLDGKRPRLVGCNIEPGLACRRARRRREGAK